MNAINILFGIAFLYSLGANFSAARKGIKEKLTRTTYKPKTYLQKTPPNVSALIIVLQVAGIFGIAEIFQADDKNFMTLRLTGLIGYILFSFLQVKSFKTLGKNYSQDIAILQNHELVTSGLYRNIRHPQYLFQILSDIFAGIALFNYLVLFFSVFTEFPLFLLRAMREEEILKNHFKDEFIKYKSRSGFMLPFIG
jgi:protein-S-isoprenylcysteine O-methyltransferase Ste14